MLHSPPSLLSVLIYWSWKRNTWDRSPQKLIIYRSETSNNLGWFLCQFYQKLVSFSCVETNIKVPINILAYRTPVRSNILLEKLSSDQNKTGNQTETHMERCPTDPLCSLGEHGPGNVMAQQIGADSSDLKPRSKTAAKLWLRSSQLQPDHTECMCVSASHYSFSAFTGDPAWKARLLWPRSNQTKPLPHHMAKFLSGKKEIVHPKL